MSEMHGAFPPNYPRAWEDPLAGGSCCEGAPLDGNPGPAGHCDEVRARSEKRYDPLIEASRKRGRKLIAGAADGEEEPAVEKSGPAKPESGPEKRAYVQAAKALAEVAESCIGHPGVAPECAYTIARLAIWFLNEAAA